MTGMSSPGLRSCKRLSSAQCHTKMARSTLSEGTRLALYVPGQAPRWAPLLTHTTTCHGTCKVTITVPPSFYRLINSGGVDFLSQHLDTGNLRFIYFSKSLNLLWPHTQWSQWQNLVSIENPSPPSKRSCSNLGLSHSQKKEWGVSFGTVFIPVVLSPSQCLLVPRKRRDALSMGTGPQRASPLFSRLKSTQWALYWPPNHPWRGRCTVPNTDTLSSTISSRLRYSHFLLVSLWWLPHFQILSSILSLSEDQHHSSQWIQAFRSQR